MSEQQELVTVTIDGVELKAPRNAMLIEVADQAGIDIPRFCYHKHLSVAANCRMCMVEVEKARKPLPACATPVNEGMVVYTRSPLALDAQKGTMEFLLINHPLDCPVCDQGGECELQDVAMGYGSDVSRFTERKRVVKDKKIGPLVSTDMTRCIHCTRCVRFGQEIAGVRDLGATGRGEFMEIGTYVEKSLSSELSGNVIDLCPVGALNAKPSRMKGRSWEMFEHQTISPHDSFGSNLILHTLRGEVIRAVPQENPEINETWISDRDRFSYEGIYSEQRLKKVMRKDNDEWHTAEWSDALQNITQTLKEYSPQEIGILISPNQTNEELYLMQKIANALGIKNIDHRVHQTDFSDQDHDPSFPWLGMPITDVENQDVIVVVGSDLRAEQPMLAHKVRQATLRGAKVIVINPQHCEFFMDLSTHYVFTPQQWLEKLASVNQGEQFSELVSLLKNAERSCVLLGGLAQQHYEYSSLRAVAYQLAQNSSSAFGYISVSSNASGASLLGALPHRKTMAAPTEEPGKHYVDMVNDPCKVYLLMGLEPEFDCALPAQTISALQTAEQVISLNSFTTESMREYCDWLLPLACFAETEGTKVNLEGRWQSFVQTINADGEVKEGWKILRMLGVELELDGFDFNSIEKVRSEIREQIDPSFAFTNALPHIPQVDINSVSFKDFQRVGSKPIYSIDALVRNAMSLQEAQKSMQAEVALHANDMNRLGLEEDDFVEVTQDEQAATFKCTQDNNLIEGTAYIPSGLVGSEKLGAIYGEVQIKKAEGASS
ncbi:MAG: NADH-quinone oxidoreductase subunit NuoG [Pseudomonadota bacterium]